MFCMRSSHRVHRHPQSIGHVLGIEVAGGEIEFSHSKPHYSFFFPLVVAVLFVFSKYRPPTFATERKPCFVVSTTSEICLMTFKANAQFR